MSKWAHFITTSLGGIRCCDGEVTQVDPANPTAWRSLVSSITCVLDGGGNKTGYANVATLQQYYTNTGLPTGTTKSNTPSDPDYQVDYLDTTMCATTGDDGDIIPPQVAELDNYTAASDFKANITCNYPYSVTHMTTASAGHQVTSYISGSTFDVQVIRQTGHTHATINCNGYVQTIDAPGDVTFSGIVGSSGILISVTEETS